jgi:hypothetical protein
MDDLFCSETLMKNMLLYAPSKDDDLLALEKYLEAPPEECTVLDLPEQFTVEVCIRPLHCCNAY